MNLEFPTREVREGLATFLVPDVPALRGPGKRTALPFYNPFMAVNRDITLLALAAALPPKATVLDGLAASGVFGLRAALETAKEPEITWNDKNPNAHELIVENAQRNGVAGSVLREDLRVVLARRRWTYVDIDPFGTPLPFVDAAVQQSWRGAMLGITATDTAPLAGTYPETCWRRYGARSIRTPCGGETALRILLGYLVRVAASHERALRPIVGFSAEHFVKAIVAVDVRAGAVSKALAQIGYVRFEGPRFETSSAPPAEQYAGPLWLGPTTAPEIVAAMPSRAETGVPATRLLGTLRAESGLPPFFYENHALAQTLGHDPVPILDWIDSLRASGFRAARPHVSMNGVKTDAPWEDVVRTYKSLSGAGSVTAASR